MVVDTIKDYAAKHYVYLHNVLLGLVRHAVLPRYWGQLWWVVWTLVLTGEG